MFLTIHYLKKIHLGLHLSFFLFTFQWVLCATIDPTVSLHWQFFRVLPPSQTFLKEGETARTIFLVFCFSSNWSAIGAWG